MWDRVAYLRKRGNKKNLLVNSGILRRQIMSVVIWHCEISLLLLRVTCFSACQHVFPSTWKTLWSGLNFALPLLPQLNPSKLLTLM